MHKPDAHVVSVCKPDAHAAVVFVLLKAAFIRLLFIVQNVL